MSIKSEMYSSKKAMMKHEKNEASKERMMEYGKKAVKKAAAKKVVAKKVAKPKKMV